MHVLSRQQEPPASVVGTTRCLWKCWTGFSGPQEALRPSNDLSVRVCSWSDSIWLCSLL